MAIGKVNRVLTEKEALEQAVKQVTELLDQGTTLDEILKRLSSSETNIVTSLQAVVEALLKIIEIEREDRSLNDSLISELKIMNKTLSLAFELEITDENIN